MMQKLKHALFANKSNSIHEKIVQLSVSNVYVRIKPDSFIYSKQKERNVYDIYQTKFILFTSVGSVEHAGHFVDLVDWARFQQLSQIHINENMG